MSIKFIKSGLQTSLQDLGRQGYRALGIPQSGAIDNNSLKLANWLVGNPFSNPCLEVYLSGPSLQFTQDIAIGIAGAKFEIFINDTLITTDNTLHLNKGDVLQFGKLISGARAYLAFNAIPKDKQYLDSYSCDTTSKLGYNSGKAFIDSEILNLDYTPHSKEIRSLPTEHNVQYPKNMLIRVTKGMEFDLLTKTAKQKFFQQPFIVSPNSNRMGLRTSGNVLEIEHDNSMTSSPVTIGTIQLPPSGQPIVLLNEAQTIGGYPRIAQVISSDLPLLGQIRPNTQLSFYPVDFEKALDLIDSPSSNLFLR